MPFAEWFYRMHERDVPPQARALAVCVVLFKITSNEQLAIHSGMSAKGKTVADKTYNKWKRFLSDDGWLIVKSITIGRNTTIEVFPALDAIPVIITDVRPRDLDRIGKNKNYGRRELITDDDERSSVENTDERRNSYGSQEQITDEPKTSPAPARVEDNINIYNNYNNLTTPTSTPEPVAAREFDFQNFDYSKFDKSAFDQLEAKLVGACNGAFVNNNSPSVKTLTLPIAWLNSGCDLNLDILPTLRAIGATKHGEVGDWRYFDKAVRKARDERLNPKPKLAKVGARQVPREEGQSFEDLLREQIQKGGV